MSERGRGGDGVVRRYSLEEHGAFRAVSHREWGEAYQIGRGPAEFAGGAYWPAELNRRANQMERLIPLYRLAADALAREILADPRCETPEPPPETNQAAALASEEDTMTIDNTRTDAALAEVSRRIVNLSEEAYDRTTLRVAAGIVAEMRRDCAASVAGLLDDADAKIETALEDARGGQW